MKRAILLGVIGLCGCAAPNSGNVVDPKAISLEDAMESLGKSFNKFSKGMDDSKLGVVPCSIDVNFKIAATGSDTTSGGVKGQLAVAPFISFEGSQSANRSNDVTIKFVHVACLPKETLGYNNPNGVNALISSLSSGSEDIPLMEMTLDKYLVDGPFILKFTKNGIVHRKAIEKPDMVK